LANVVSAHLKIVGVSYRQQPSTQKELLPISVVRIGKIMTITIFNKIQTSDNRERHHVGCGAYQLESVWLNKLKWGVL